ncbi:RluA family pseudouridine synthase [Chelatococcus sp. SYSU_G07232]|uniref:Pseudouridine synthase n=1 Tax=Chelatococcus albus TaxID=3047466 RepID=A0ABT7AFT9_9HYPH|nr:RluA family pseudouridine synthase [Chelatococcus sp. SYSU_G07232]MDJ1158224.1 RluA family pseudouridine synthase [Chelatococcus sp. SYSU_G07232]
MDATNAAGSGGTLRRFVVAADQAGRLDRMLAAAAAELSRSRLQQLIKAGHVTLDGQTVTNAKHKVTAGMQVALTLPEAVPPEPAPEAIPLTIIYEDEDLVVIDKPAGLVVHPAPGNETGTLVNALIAHCGDTLSGIGGVKRPGIVHRLDKDTSGLMVVAKTDRAHQALSAQFADHGRTGPLERAYLAVVWGVPAPQRGSVVAPIDRSPRNREKMAVVPEGRGRTAITHYAVEQVFAAATGQEPVASLVRCHLETGRTHQIRVHMAHIGHPLLGDALYGSGFRTKANRLDDAARERLAALARQALHATLLGFAHPATGEPLHFESEPPADLAALIAALSGNRHD